LPSGVSSGASELQRDPKTLHGKNVRKKDLEGTQRKHRTHESRTSHARVTHTHSEHAATVAGKLLSGSSTLAHALSLYIYSHAELTSGSLAHFFSHMGMSGFCLASMLR
jgi:hypothetical protein